MIATIIFFIFFGALSYSYGWGFLTLLQRIIHIKTDEKLSFPWVMAAGLVSITTIGMVLNFWIPLSSTALGIVVAGGVIIAVVLWKRLKTGWHAPFMRSHYIFWILVILVAFAVIEHSTHQPSNPDTGIYHAQTIRWMEEYPLVPGLGNLNSRFAYNSSWLVVNALFSFSFLGIQSFHLLPSAFFILTMLICLEGACGWLRGKTTPANILKTLLIPCAFYVLSSEISSPGTDLPVVLIVWWLAAGWLERGEDSTGNRPLLEVVIFLLSIYAFTIKLSAGPLVFFAILLMGIWRTQNRKLALMAAMAAIILLPWMARSVILSGYPLFPIAGVPGFNLDWRIAQSDVVNEQMGIIAYGRNPRMSMDEVLQMPFSAWLKMWYYNQTINRKILLIFAGVAPLLFGFSWIATARWAGNRLSSKRQLLEVLVILLTGMSFWLFTSPDFRFGYGYLIALLLISLLIPIASIRIVNKNSVIVLLVIVLYLVFFIARSFEHSEFGQRLILPSDYKSLPTQPCDLKNAKVLCPADISWSQCWYNPFPCAPFPRPEVEMRGSDWRDGFRKSN